MNKKIRNVFISIFAALFICIVMSLFKLETLTLCLLITVSIGLLFLIKNIYNNYINLTMLFTGFHVLYGLVGPITYLWIGGFPKIYGTNFNISAYLLAYTLATIGIVIALYVSKLKKVSTNNEIEDNYDKKYISFFRFMAYLVSIGTTAGELLNFIRVGGFETLYKGKAVYQAMVSDLFLTVPTSIIFELALALIGVSIILSNKDDKKLDKKFIILNSLILLPYLIIKIMLGQRGLLLSGIIIIFLIFSYIKPIRKITFKLVGIGLICYFFLSFLFIIRPGIKYLFSDFDMFVNIATKKERLVQVINPGSNEFSCVLGNFNTLYVSDDYQFMYGKSYFQGMFNFVPSYLYPGEKPQMITYQFRDKYFPEESKRSRIAGTGFSSIMEAYWNFGYIGIAIIYSLITFALMYLENKAKNKNVWWLIFYFAVSPLVISFHRSEYGDINTKIVWNVIFIGLIYLFYILNKKNNFKYIELPCDIVRKIFSFVNDKVCLKKSKNRNQ